MNNNDELNWNRQLRVVCFQTLLFIPLIFCQGVSYAIGSIFSPPLPSLLLLLRPCRSSSSSEHTAASAASWPRAGSEPGAELIYNNNNNIKSNCRDEWIGSAELLLTKNRVCKLPCWAIVAAGEAGSYEGTLKFQNDGLQLASFENCQASTLKHTTRNFYSLLCWRLILLNFFFKLTMSTPPPPIITLSLVHSLPTAVGLLFMSVSFSGTAMAQSINHYWNIKAPGQPSRLPDNDVFLEPGW